VTYDPLRDLHPQPTGFGTCRRCPYRDVGAVAICYPCASRTMPEPPTPGCKVCDQALSGPGVPCGNPVCNWPTVPDSPRQRNVRWFEWNFAVAMRGGELKRAISNYKYDEVRGWAVIFGRVLAGFLHEHRTTFEPFDLVIPSPTYVGKGGRGFDHTATVLAEAARLDQTGLPFVLDPPALVKTKPTKRLVDCSGWQERRHICENILPPALKVADPGLVDGAAILVYDDVFTDGLNINAVAKKLREAGAEVVCQVTLAREPWRGR
jgi:predicted amidophosphoribosyltransferase